MSHLVWRCGRKPWVVTVLIIAATVLCADTSSNGMAWLWVCPLYLLTCAIEVFTCNKSWLRRVTAVQNSPRTFSGAPKLDYILQELVRISALLLYAGSFVPRVWLEPKFSKSTLSQFSYWVLFLHLPYCLAPVALMCVQCLRRSIEFSSDQEAQDTVEILGGLQWLK
jgi:hypothetical protein